MGNGATAADTAANNDYSGWEKNTLGNYNSDLGAYTSNVNSQIAVGNPYTSKAYLENQNVLTSGAMNSANTKATQQLRDTALRTGTNSAAVAAGVADQRRQGQRDLTQYNATAANENEDKWLRQQQELTRDQLAGANSEAGVFGTQASGRGNALSNLTSAQNAEDQMWGQLGPSAISGAAEGLTAAFA